MKVIITDCDHDNIEIEKKIFADAGIEMELKHAISEDEVIEQCQDAEILIVQYAKITRKVMEHCPRLKFVVRYGVGVDTIDVAAAAEFGVQIGNVPDYGMNEVADHAIALALSMTREIVKMNQFTKNEKWDYTKAIPIHRFSNLTVASSAWAESEEISLRRCTRWDFRLLERIRIFLLQRKPTPM